MLQNVAGCDSVVTLRLTVNPTIPKDDSITICSAQLPYTWYTKTNAQSGDTLMLQNVAGCDSVVTLRLTVNPTIATNDSITICSAQVPYTWHGKANAQSGDTLMLQNVAGCDSVITLRL